MPLKDPLGSASHGPAIAVTGQRRGNGFRHTAILLNIECKAGVSFEVLMGLGNVANQEEGPGKRGLRDTNFLQNFENYGFEDHKPAWQEAVQCGINQGGSKRWVFRYEGKNNKRNYGSVLRENDQDAAVRETATVAMARTTSASNKTGKKVMKAIKGKAVDKTC